MVDEPLVSVIILTLNSAKYIGRCLTSMVKQSYAQKEIMIIDAGSVDNTIGIINKFRDQLDIYYFSLINSSQGDARNLGLDQAKGKYVTFCDSDDFYLRDKIKTQVEVMEQENIDVTYFDILHFKTGKEKKLFTKSQALQRGELLSQFLTYFTLGLNAVMVRKSFLDGQQIRFPSGEAGRYSEDSCFIFQMIFLKAVFKKISRHLAVTHIRNDSSTQWDIKWKMTKYAMRYLQEVQDKLAPVYQHKLSKALKKWRFQLGMALIIVGDYDAAKQALKQDTSLLIARGIDIVFFLLKNLPKSLVKQSTIFLWKMWSKLTRRTYVTVSPEIHQQIAGILASG